jgi:tRNA pseudouridine38-40 synthase
MQHWKITLSYDGTPYNGWQIQPHLPTVQGTLAAAIQHVTSESVLPQGSGRTDTGVHALGQVATFSTNVPIPAKNLHHALNRALPPSIRILSVEPVAPSFHARHSAIRKTYEYRILPCATPATICPPMLAPYVWANHRPLDLDLLQAAAQQILGEHDFTSFAASDPDLATRTSESESKTEAGKSPIRTILHSAWHKDGDLLILRVTGNGFLHHMVRNLVGTFAEIGSHRLPPDAIPQILAARNRSAAGLTAPARGLFLVNVEYPESGAQA